MQEEWHKAIKSLKKYIHLSIYVYKNGGLPLAPKAWHIPIRSDWSL
jgi:hypothetical protein